MSIRRLGKNGSVAKSNSNEMKVKAIIDPNEEIRKSIDFLKNYLKNIHS